MREPSRGAGGAHRRPLSRMRMPLLDRLIDTAPEQAVDLPMTQGDGLEALRRSVQRDLEMLLNSRRRWRGWPASLGELDRSSLAYGIADYTAGSFHDKQASETLRAEIEDTLRRFEPRFAQVRVALAESGNPLDATLRLQIDALLHADPAPEPIRFETVLDATTADVVVRACDV